MLVSQPLVVSSGAQVAKSFSQKHVLLVWQMPFRLQGSAHQPGLSHTGCGNTLADGMHVLAPLCTVRYEAPPRVNGVRVKGDTHRKHRHLTRNHVTPLHAPHVPDHPRRMFQHEARAGRRRRTAGKQGSSTPPVSCVADS